MNFQKLLPQLFGITLVMSLLVGCGTSQAAIPMEVPTFTPVPDTPTLPPTETATPTIPPTDTPQPTAVLAPEQQATSVEQIVGRWSVRLMGGGEGDPSVLTFKPDGTYDWIAVGGYHEGMNMEYGTFYFEDGLLKLDSEICYKYPGGFFHCVATYEAYVALGENGPGKLRFVMVEDEYVDRVKTLDGKTLLPAPQE